MLTNLSTLRGCLVAALGHLESLLHSALGAAFQGDGEATRYITAPLLEQQGPLDDMLVKARLLVALGCIEPAAFADIDKLRQLRDKVVTSPEEIGFSSPVTLQALATLEHFDARTVAQFESRLSVAPEDPALRSQYLLTVDNSIRSALALAVVTIEQKIQPILNK